MRHRRHGSCLYIDRGGTYSYFLNCAGREVGEGRGGGGDAGGGAFFAKSVEKRDRRVVLRGDRSVVLSRARRHPGIRRRGEAEGVTYQAGEGAITAQPSPTATAPTAELRGERARDGAVSRDVEMQCRRASEAVYTHRGEAALASVRPTRHVKTLWLAR